MASVILSWKRVVASVRVHSPTAIRRGIRDVLRHEPLLQPLIKASGGEWNVMEAVYLALRDAVRTMNGDKQYFLQKLREHNKAAEELSDYLARLVETSEQLAAQEGNDPYDDDCPSDQPKRWLAGLPVRQIPLPVLNLNRHGGLPEKPKRR